MSEHRSNQLSRNRFWMRNFTCRLIVNTAIVVPLCSHAISSLGAQQSLSSSALNASASSQASSVHSGGATVAPEDVSTMKLMPGSMVNVRVFEESDLDGSYRLDQHGNISFPSVGIIRLESLTLRQAEAAIREKLVSERILKVANVDVDLAEYSALKITVLGEVGAAGSFPVLGPRRLQDVLALAGGETSLAGSEIVVQRFGAAPIVTETIHYNRNGNDTAPLNTSINPGDTVLVKKAGIVYVLGAVNRPGGYLMQEAGELNLNQALAMALGTSMEAKVGDLRIFRKMGDGSLAEIHADYKKINSGKASPLPLQAQDVVYVPTSSIKAVLLRGGTQVVNSAATATIYKAY